MKPSPIALALLACLSWPAYGAGDGACALPVSSPLRLSGEHPVGEEYMGVRLLGAVKLDPVLVDGLALVELSGLAWDEDEARLYAVSDRGAVFHLQPRIVDGVLKTVRLCAAHALTDERGRALQGSAADAEGLVARGARNGVAGDTELVVSFEVRPRVLRFSPRGRFRGALDLPEALRHGRSYRAGNRGLEAIAWHPEHGYLVAPEQGLAGAPPGHVGLYAIERGRRWSYVLAPEPNAALVALEVLADGALLALERAHGPFFLPVISTLRRVARLAAPPAGTLEPVTVARFSSGAGWRLDNFEGLTRERGRRIFIVSDDNGRGYQTTLLVLLELLR